MSRFQMQSYKKKRSAACSGCSHQCSCIPVRMPSCKTVSAIRVMLVTLGTTGATCCSTRQIDNEDINFAKLQMGVDIMRL